MKNLLASPRIAQELRKSYDALKRVCKISLESDSITPALDATLSWLKQAGCDSLPTSKSGCSSMDLAKLKHFLVVDFEEAELDYVSNFTVLGCCFDLLIIFLGYQTVR